MSTVEGWEKNKLGNICSIEIGGTPSRNNPQYWDTDNSTLNYWVSIRDLNKRTITNTNERLSNLGVRNSNVKLQKKGTVLLSFKLSIGRTAFAGIDLFTNEAIAGLSTDSLDNCYLYYGLQHWDLLKGVDQAIKGATLNKAKLKEIEIFYPESLQEQNKIAEILSCIDTAIEQTEAMIAKQQRIKTGLMQDLLSKGIDEHGNIRTEQTHAFKDSELGRIPVEWEVLPISHLIDLQVGYAFKSKDFRDDGILLLRGENVGHETPDWGDKKYLALKSTDDFKDYQLNDGDIVIGMDRTFTKQGCKISAIGNNDLPSLLVQRVGRFLFKNTVKDFIALILTSKKYQSTLQLLQKGMDIPHLSKEEILSPLIPIPKKQEQELIAKYVRKLEQETQLEKQNLHKIKRQKTALMQDLLSGNVRVNHLLKTQEIA
jgi:type I restriction enzyme S subunit